MRSRFSVVKQFVEFARIHRKWWLLPMLAVLLLFGMLMVFAQGSAFAPFIYTIF